MVSHKLSLLSLFYIIPDTISIIIYDITDFPIDPFTLNITDTVSSAIYS